MDIFGLTGIQAIISIAVSGVVLQNVVGWLKGTDPFNVRMAAASGIIAFFASLIVIGPQIEAIPDDITDESKFLLFIGLIAQIAGFDILVKNGAKAVIARVKRILKERKSFDYDIVIAAHLELERRKGL